MHTSFYCFNDYWQCQRCNKKFLNGKFNDEEICPFTIRRTYSEGHKIEQCWLTGRISKDSLPRHLTFLNHKGVSWAKESYFTANAFANQLQKGDEIWTYTTPKPILNRTWCKSGESGIAIVRNNKIFDTMRTCCHIISVYVIPDPNAPKKNPFYRDYEPKW